MGEDAHVAEGEEPGMAWMMRMVTVVVFITEFFVIAFVRVGIIVGQCRQVLAMGSCIEGMKLVVVESY